MSQTGHWPACPPQSQCLADGQFEVRVTAHAPDGDFIGKRAAGTAESAVFTFFSANNWEMLVKVLDGCAINNHYWVFAAATTDVEYVLTVTDTATGEAVGYFNPLDQASPAITDTGAVSLSATIRRRSSAVHRRLVSAITSKLFMAMSRHRTGINLADASIHPTT